MAFPAGFPPCSGPVPFPVWPDPVLFFDPTRVVNAWWSAQVAAWNATLQLPAALAYEAERAGRVRRSVSPSGVESLNLARP